MNSKQVITGVLVCLAAVLCRVDSAFSAETVLFYSRFGHDIGGCLGFRLAGGRDLDGDGVADFLASEPNTCPGGTFANGKVFAYSGLTGRMLYGVSSTAPRDYFDDFGASVAFLDDVDGDHVSDFLCVAPRGGSFYVYSGATGQLLYQRYGETGLGSSVSGIADLDGDGRGDLLIGDPYALNGHRVLTGQVVVYSGATGSVLRTLQGQDSTQLFGQTVASAGDLDGDGVEDVLVRTVGDNSESVYAYSGRTGFLLYRVGHYPGAAFGTAIASLGDIDGDGRPDFAVGAPGEDSVFIYSGATGSPIHQLGRPFQTLHSFGSSMTVCDVNGDGIEDLVIGEPTSGLFTGTVFVYSTNDWSLVLKVDGTTNYEMLGQAVASAGDVNGDGAGDFLAGAPSEVFGTDFMKGAILVYGLATVQSARVVSSNGTPSIRLSAGTDTVRVRLEPVGSSYSISDILTKTIVLRDALDPVAEVASVGASLGQDSDANGAPEISASFLRSDMRDLLGIRTSPADTATLIIEANSTSGTRIRVVSLFEIHSSPPAVVTLAPNPMRGRGALSFVTTRGGPLTVKLFDVSGRLVRDLIRDTWAPAGYHDVPIDGRGSRGEVLGSGIYFYRVETTDGLSSGRIVLVR